jgi:regulator of sigma E protease
MSFGKITAVQDNSPAARAGIKPGDFIEKVDGEPPDDPMTLGDRLAEDAGKTITLSVRRDTPGGQSEVLTKSVTLRVPLWYEESVPGGTPMSVPSLGIAYKVLNIVHATAPDSPAAKAELEQDGKPAAVAHFVQGDQIAKAQFLQGDAKVPDGKEKLELPDPIEFSAEKPNWPFFSYCLQIVPPGVKVRLTLTDGRTTVLSPVDSGDSFNPDRGLLNDSDTTIYKAHGFSAAAAAGARETLESSLLIYRFLNALITGRVSPKNLGGPLSIFNAASDAASVGPAQLLLFLTMLSANLAVINFLPIPLLDGGHMVFLILEGILRRPVSERVVVAFHYLGFVFIISLMLFVLGLDFHLIPRTR